MPDTSARLGLPFLLPAQAQKHVTHNEALQRLDTLTQLVLEERGGTIPPAAPQVGAIHAVGAAPQGAWAGQAGMLAQWAGSAWDFVAPQEGWRAWCRADGQLCAQSGGDWLPVVPDLQNLDGVGIGTGSDPVNRLAVASEAALFSHAGAGHQIKINKAAAGDTASLLYQSGWTGHAEMGLAGDTDFSIKVSADGSGWTTALAFDAATGLARGAAVQDGPTDVTPGRLARADHAYGPGNLLGPVAQAGGVPTGAVIERGANANGAYVRFADGTQICTANNVGDTLSLNGDQSASGLWTYPAGFASGGDVHHVFATARSASATAYTLAAAERLRTATGPSASDCHWAVFAQDVALSTVRVDITAIGLWA